MKEVERILPRFGHFDVLGMPCHYPDGDKTAPRRQSVHAWTNFHAQALHSTVASFCSPLEIGPLCDELLSYDLTDMGDLTQNAPILMKGQVWETLCKIARFSQAFEDCGFLYEFSVGRLPTTVSVDHPPDEAVTRAVSHWG
jgi:hypothetical protein